MSTDRTLLKHPLVIAGVALGLIVVALLNLHTFLGVGSLLGLGSGHTEDPLAPPSDLAEVVQEAMYADRLVRRLSTAQQGAGLGLARDPFTGVAPEVAIKPPVTRRIAQPQGVRPLACTAVFLGGRRPLALIDDEILGPGDTVRGLDIVSIDAEGVWLRRSDGSETHLEVASGEGSPDGYHLVTGVRREHGHTRTPPADSLANEGTER